MGAEGARKLAGLPTAARVPRDARSERLAAVGEVVRLYQDLEHALARAGDGELARLAAAARSGERALGECARRLETVRTLKRHLESGVFPTDEPAWQAVPTLAPPSAWTVDPGELPPLVWEALAFVVGFTVSFLVT